MMMMTMAIIQRSQYIYFLVYRVPCKETNLRLRNTERLSTEWSDIPINNCALSI